MYLNALLPLVFVLAFIALALNNADDLGPAWSTATAAASRAAATVRPSFTHNNMASAAQTAAGVAATGASAGTSPGTPAATGGRNQPPPPPPNPFVRAAREHVEPFLDKSDQLVSGTTIARDANDVPAFGFVRHIILEVVASGGDAGGNPAVANEDSPWNVLQSIAMLDTNGNQLFGPLDGFSTYLANKWGAYVFVSDPASGPRFDDVDADGNFSFLLRVPIEIAQRDGLGALANTHSNASYKLNYTLNDPSRVYDTQPDTLPSVRVRCWLEAWTQPPVTDIRGFPNALVPPALGTAQYWSKSTINVLAGEQRLRLTRMGNLIRNIVFVLRDQDPKRVTGAFPDPFRLELDGIPIVNIGRGVQRQYMAERSGNALDAGVIVLDYTHDLLLRMGNEMRDLYIPTSNASRLELVGTFGAEGVLDVLTNDIAPSGDVYLPLDA